MEPIARTGARTTPLDPRFANHLAHLGAGQPSRAPATRVLVTSRRGVRTSVVVVGGESMAALNSAIVTFEAEGDSAVDGPEPPTLEELARYGAVMLDDGGILPKGMTLGTRAVRVRILRRNILRAHATRKTLMVRKGNLGRWLTGLYRQLGVARDSLRVAILGRADPGRIRVLTESVRQLEGRVSFMEREMKDVTTQIGVISSQIETMSAELHTFGEAV